MKQTKQAGAAALPKSGYFAMVCILIAGSLWGCLGVFNRHLSALGIAPETVVMLRNLGACLILGLIFLVYDRSIFAFASAICPFSSAPASSAFSFLPSATSAASRCPPWRWPRSCSTPPLPSW